MADAVGGDIDTVTAMTAVTAARRSIVAAGLAAGALVLGGCEAIISDTYEYGEIETVVERRNGDPVPGVELTLFTGARPMDFGETGEDGSHTFDLVPFGEYGVTTTRPEGYVRIEEVLGGPPSHTQDGIVLGEGEEATVEFILLRPGPGDIRFVATDESGTPVEGVRVELFRPLEILTVDTTGATGEVLFADLPFGVYGVVATLPDRFVAAGESRHVVHQDLIPEEGITELVELTVGPCTGSITVEVVSPEGEGVQGFPVDLYNAERVLDRAETGPGGSHTFGGLLCREFGVALGRLPGWIVEEGRGTSFIDGIVLTRTEPDREVTFEVTPAG